MSFVPFYRIFPIKTLKNIKNKKILDYGTNM